MQIYCKILRTYDVRLILQYALQIRYKKHPKNILHVPKINFHFNISTKVNGLKYRILTINRLDRMSDTQFEVKDIKFLEQMAVMQQIMYEVGNIDIIHIILL